MVGEWPNGIAGGFGAPAIAVPTYPQPYDTIAYEVGYPIPLQLYDVVVVNKGTWVSDGITALLYGVNNVFSVALAAPPWALVASGYLQLSNFHMLLGIDNAVVFKGSFTYTTNS